MKSAGGGIENNKPVREDLIICEGIDDQRFLCWLLKYPEFMGDGKSPFFQVVTSDGKDRLETRLRILQRQEGFNDSFNRVKSITVIFDADTDPDKAAKHIERAFRGAGLAVPEGPGSVTRDLSAEYAHIATGYSIFPRLEKTLASGSLEDLCIAILQIENSAQVLQSANKALQETAARFTNRAKNLLHACLSLTDKHVGQTIGQAAISGAFNPASPLLAQLKTFLRQMVASHDSERE